VQRQKCDHLATVLVGPQYGDENLTEMSEEVLANMRSNMICAGIALNDKDIDQLGAVLSLQADVSNELLRRVAIYAESEEKKYNKLQEDYKALVAYQLANVPARAVSVISGHSVPNCSRAIETKTGTPRVGLILSRDSLSQWVSECGNRLRPQPLN